MLEKEEKKQDFYSSFTTLVFAGPVSPRSDKTK
jgi:hypothetical protein